MHHPFAGSKGSKRRQALLNEVAERDGFTCNMCGCILYPGKRRSNSAVLDHLIPIRLRPDLTWDAGNMQLVCKRCHDTTCQSIEAQFSNNPEMIKKAKQRGSGFDANGRPLW